MQLDAKMIEKVEALALLLKRRPEQVLDEALDLYLKQEREKLLEVELEEHKKETNLSYDEFWGDMDFD
jgi:hypothetical protein